MHHAPILHRYFVQRRAQARRDHRRSVLRRLMALALVLVGATAWLWLMLTMKA